jgi:hypothetical protein
MPASTSRLARSAAGLVFQFLNVMRVVRRDRRCRDRGNCVQRRLAKLRGGHLCRGAKFEVGDRFAGGLEEVAQFFGSAREARALDLRDLRADLRRRYLKMTLFGCFEEPVRRDDEPERFAAQRAFMGAGRI